MTYAWPLGCNHTNENSISNYRFLVLFVISKTFTFLKKYSKWFEFRSISSSSTAGLWSIKENYKEP